MDDELYVIKFGLKDTFANNLIDLGELHFKCLKYYILQEKRENKAGQGDVYEGSIGNLMYKYSYNPVYCAYLVTKKDIVSLKNKNYIKVDLRIAEDFMKNNTSFVVIQFDEFLKRTKNLNNGNLNIATINYCNVGEKNNLRTLDDWKQEFALISDNTGLCAFRKNKRLYYQNEIRIMLGDLRLNINEVSGDCDGMNLYIGNLSKWAFKNDLNHCQIDEKFFYIPIEEKSND